MPMPKLWVPEYIGGLGWLFIGGELGSDPDDELTEEDVDKGLEVDEESFV